MPKVSITMATYNVAPYLRECLESVCNQTFRDIEIIIIDDNSKDGTKDILEEYRLKDDRIQIVLKNKNEGLSVSRNTALSMAKGDYVTFVDGDDIIDLTLIEKAYTNLVSNNTDLVLWDYCPFYDSRQISDIDRKASSMITLKCNDKTALLKRPGFACSRMFKRELVDKFNLHFPEGLTKQDIPIHWKLVTALEKISILPERLYFYRVQPTATSARKDRSVFSLAYVMDIVKKQLLQDGLYDTYKNEFLCQKVSRLQGMYDFVKPEYKTEAMEIIKERLDNDCKIYIYSPKCECSYRTIRFFKGYFYGNLIAKLQYDFIMLTRSFYRLIKR